MLPRRPRNLSVLLGLDDLWMIEHFTEAPRKLVRSEVRRSACGNVRTAATTLACSVVAQFRAFANEGFSPLGWTQPASTMTASALLTVRALSHHPDDRRDRTRVPRTHGTPPITAWSIAGSYDHEPATRNVAVLTEKVARRLLTGRRTVSGYSPQSRCRYT